jgi:hypothetical protein
MALIFGALTSDRVNHGSDSSLDNLVKETFMVWMFPTTLTDLRRIYQKRTSSPQKGVEARLANSTGGTADIRWQKDASTSGGVIRITNDLRIIQNAWNCVAVTGDVSGAGAGGVFIGSLTTPLSESTYGTNTNDAVGGAAHNDAAVSMLVGNGSALNIAFQGRIASAARWNRVLSLGEMHTVQFHGPQISGSGLVLFTHYGYNGTDTQPDWSGNSNSGAVTGATVGAHVPLGPLFGRKFGLPYLSPAVIAAGQAKYLPLLGVG